MLKIRPFVRAWISLPVMAAAMLAGCGPSPVANLPEDRLPREAAQAFIRYTQDLSDDELSCSVMAVAHAPRAEIDINEDGQMDFAIDTRRLSCGAPAGRSSVAYFCGLSACSYPAIISQGEDWVVVPLMSGNSIDAIAHYTEPRFQVRSMERLLTGASSVLVRDYAWRQGALRRVNEEVEVPRRMADRR